MIDGGSAIWPVLVGIGLLLFGHAVDRLLEDDDR